MDKYFVKIYIDDKILKNIPNDVLLGVNDFMNWINRKLGAETTIEYRIQDTQNLEILYEIKYYNNEQRKKSLKDLAEQKVNEIQKYLENLNSDVFNTNILYFVRTLCTIIGEDIFRNMFYITIEGIKDYKSRKLKIKIPKLRYVEYKISELQDGSKIRQYIDPYIENYGLFIDYSKPMDEFNYMYNGLHIYEHYVTYAWKDINNKNLIYYNGSTYSNGICLVYCISKSAKDIRDRLISSIAFHIQSSDANFIRKTKALQTETIRTISETYFMRNLTRLGRSDQQAYNDNTYKEEVLAYWSSQPMNILIVTNNEISFNIDKLNEFYKQHHKDNKKPRSLSFSYFPKEVFFSHYTYGMYTHKKDMKKILKKIYNNENTTSIYGIGNRQKVDGIDLSNDQNVLSQLLIFANYTDDDIVRNYIKKNVFPNDVIGFLEYKTTNVLQFVNDNIDLD